VRYLMVTTFPPTHCGIGAYGEQHVAQLREQGNTVDVLSPDQLGNVDFAWDLKGESKILKLLDLLPYYDRVVIQYHWAFFYSDPFLPEHRWETLRTNLSFILLYLRSRKIEIIAHEIPYLSGKSGWLYKWQWKLVPKVVMHTPTELERFESHYHMRLPKSRLEMRTHHDVFQKFSGHTKESARRQLGIPRDKLVFLCIGFIQRHKGFHRAMQEFSRANLRHAQLYVVGSMRVPDSENQKYLDELRQIEREHQDLYLRESFVSNEDFDTWLVAADWIVLPYSEIWSSGVLARARLLERPAIVSAVGGLPDQVCQRDILFNTDEELRSAFQSAASLQPSTAPPAARKEVHSTSKL
jgi:glycosyltransferase involved in cell wall biosynthesis